MLDNVVEKEYNIKKWSLVIIFIYTWHFSDRTEVIMKNLFKLLTASAFVLVSSIIYTVSASAEYSFPYDSEMGFEIPYTVVSKDEVQEPDYAVGEIHEKNMNSQYLNVKLPNGNILEMEMPRHYYVIPGRDICEESDRTIYIYDDENNLLMTRVFEEDEFPKGILSPPSTSVPGYMPIYYKGNLFLERWGRDAILKVNTETMNIERALMRTGLYPFEIQEKTMFESDGGYEMFPGTFIKGIEYCYPAGDSDEKPNYMYASGKTIKYSCDGIYYIDFQRPDIGLDKFLKKIVHGIVNGEDCLCFTSDSVQYMACKISDLKQCWNEYTENAPKVYLNDVKLAFDTPPVIENDITMMPLRYLLETAGATVDWNEESKAALITYNNMEIKITENEDVAYVNGEEVHISTAARIIDEKMMIPLRFISEELGFSVEWEQNTRSIHINTRIDNINTFVSVLSPVEIYDNRTILNGEPIKTVTAGGRTFVSIEMLKRYFSISTPLSSEARYCELTLLTEPDNSVDLTKYDIYCHSTDMVCIHRASLPTKLDGICIPVYTTKSNVNKVEYDGSLTNLTSKGFICIEETADRLDFLHYEWIAEENKLYVYIDDDMVTYDNTLKEIFDKKGIKYNEPYTGDYYKDIEAVQQYSENDLSALTQAGIMSGIIKESDYPDGLLRPTRNISHIDLARMLKGIGYNYSYDEQETNTPVTFEELNKVLSKL